MSLLGNIRDALADRIADSYPNVQVNAQALSNPTPPFIQIVPATSRRVAMGTDREFNLTVSPFVAFVDDVSSQQLVDSMISDLTAALEGDATLGGLVDSLFVGDNNGYRVLTRPDNTAWLTSDFDVKVLT